MLLSWLRRGRTSSSAAFTHQATGMTGALTRWLTLVRADGGYTGSLVEHCLAALALVLAIVKRSDDMRGFWSCPGGGSSSVSSPT
ncbi:hypothetical protein [Streptomyces sp. NPDC057052]|uniref:hypothetical protein n=1 Tax=Streptomyces sp. NPDC057052 TaxID=3346010 RepID=UPI00363E7374